MMKAENETQKKNMRSPHNIPMIGIIIFVVVVWSLGMRFGPGLWSYMKSDINKDKDKTEQITKIAIKKHDKVQFKKPDGEVISGEVETTKSLGNGQIEIHLTDKRTYIITERDIFVEK